MESGGSSKWKGRVGLHVQFYWDCPDKPMVFIEMFRTMIGPKGHHRATGKVPSETSSATSFKNVFILQLSRESSEKYVWPRCDHKLCYLRRLPLRPELMSFNVHLSNNGVKCLKNQVVVHGHSPWRKYPVQRRMKKRIGVDFVTQSIWHQDTRNNHLFVFHCIQTQCPYPEKHQLRAVWSPFCDATFTYCQTEHQTSVTFQGCSTPTTLYYRGSNKSYFGGEYVSLTSPEYSRLPVSQPWPSCSNQYKCRKPTLLTQSEGPQ